VRARRRCTYPRAGLDRAARALWRSLERAVYPRSSWSCPSFGAEVSDRDDVLQSRAREAEDAIGRVSWCERLGCRVPPTESENTRFPGVSGCRGLSTGSENTRFPGVSGCRGLSTESENTRFPGVSGCRVHSTAFEYTQSLLRRLRTDH